MTIIDVADGSRLPNQTVVIEADRIAFVGPDARANVSSDAVVVHAPGKFMIPGLWDMHTHSLNQWGWAFPLHVANGVTGIRDMATSMPMADVRLLRERIAAGVVDGPRFVTSGPLIDGPGSFRDYLKVGTPEQARIAVDSLYREGVDFIKVYEELSREAFAAIAASARARRLRVVGHAPIAFRDPTEAAGEMNSVEHTDYLRFVCTTQGPLVLAAIDEANSMNARGDSAAANELFARAGELWQEAVTTYSAPACEAEGRALRTRGTWLTPTLNLTFRSIGSMIAAPFDSVFADPRFRYVPPATRDQWQRRYEGAVTRGADDQARHALAEQAFVLAAVRDVHRGDARLLAGTDGSAAFQVYGFNLHDELGWLVDAGLTPLEALQTATLNPARYFGREDEMGRIAPGAVADLVLLDADPLLEIANTRSIHAVIAAGRLFRRDDLDELLESAL